AAAGGGEFSDAVALQFPSVPPVGNRKPYFLFGDAQASVDLWFVDLATGRGQVWTGHGSASIVLNDGDEITTQASYDRGEWTVLYRRSLASSGGTNFEPGQYVPLALSVWDGFHRERGNRRAVSVWAYLYLEPDVVVSPGGPMLRAALLALVAELLIVIFVRRRYRRADEKDAAALGHAIRP
ncbi:MAG TPA: ethylbenzene dehydrogenase-related protein, partial [Candidatus Polarisedimenticolaceae bacterium]|nr:ethylbenzene dehydrogenase-related protein [Candidatus Polarisedimenticolaceae bacterium]